MQQPEQQATTDLNEVSVDYTLSLAQVNLLLEAMAELPRKRTDGFFEHIREHARRTLMAAQAKKDEAPNGNQ